MRFIQVIHLLRQRGWRWMRPATRGVKVLVFNAGGEVLLIRNSYGNTSMFVLPGGGLRPFEQPEACARREVWEELRCRLTDLVWVGEFSSTQEGKRDRITLYSARTDDQPTAGSAEIAGFGFYPPAAPPRAISPATRRRLAEILGQAERSTDW